MAPASVVTRDAGEHRLQQRLRHAFVGIRRQREHVERGEPRRDVVAAGRRSARAGASCSASTCASSAARCGPSPTITRCASRCAQPRQRVEQVAVALPAAQRRDDADSGAPRGRPSARRAAARSSRGVTARGSMPVGTESIRAGSMPLSRISCCAQRFAGGDDARRRAAIEPARRAVVAAPGSRRGACAPAPARGRRRTSSQRQASAASQVSVELCALTTSTRPRGETRATSARDAARLLLADRQRERGHAEARRLGEDARAAARRDDDAVAARDEAGAPRSACGSPGRPSRSTPRCARSQRRVGCVKSCGASRGQARDAAVRTGCGAAARRRRRAPAARRACPARRCGRARARRCGRRARSSTAGAR